MEDDITIKVSCVSKKFSLNLMSLMKYGFYDIGRNVIGIKANSEKLRKDEFWAVNNVSFELHQGETIGIIGANGSGKSTMLKMLNGIFMPDRGIIEIKGKVGALIEVGAGFHPLLTGRENIYVNGAILGMSTKEIDDKFDCIVEFADIGDFLDSPVKNYSSGMYVRLGFAIAVHTEPEILLVDEVLAVGDIEFQSKCFNKIRQLRENGTSIILVSHNMSSIAEICKNVIWFEKGSIRKIGQVEEVLELYYKNFDEHIKYSILQNKSTTYDISSGFTIVNVALFNSNGTETKEFHYKDDLIVRIYYNATKKINDPFVVVSLKSSMGPLFEANMHIDGKNPAYLENKGFIECKFFNIPLLPGTYQIWLGIYSTGITALFNFQLVDYIKVISNVSEYGFSGVRSIVKMRNPLGILIPYEWNFK